MVQPTRVYHRLVEFLQLSLFPLYRPIFKSSCQTCELQRLHDILAQEVEENCYLDYAQGW